MTPNQVVAFNMRRLRRDRGWTQQELGERLGGRSNASVSAMERSCESKRVKKFDADEIAMIADVLGVTPNELFTPRTPCPNCQDSPPAGFTCRKCGAEGEIAGGRE